MRRSQFQFESLLGSKDGHLLWESITTTLPTEDQANTVTQMLSVVYRSETIKNTPRDSVVIRTDRQWSHHIGHDSSVDQKRSCLVSCKSICVVWPTRDTAEMLQDYMKWILQALVQRQPNHCAFTCCLFCGIRRTLTSFTCSV